MIETGRAIVGVTQGARTVESPDWVTGRNSNRHGSTLKPLECSSASDTFPSCSFGSYLLNIPAVLATSFDSCVRIVAVKHGAPSFRKAPSFARPTSVAAITSISSIKFTTSDAEIIVVRLHPLSAVNELLL